MPDGVTVVVPTLNRGEYLLDTVHDLLAQEHRPLEILIVDQSNAVDPKLELLVADNPDVISHHRVPFRGLPIARNYGWQLARHELIVYVDDDIRCGPQLIAGHAATLTRDDVDICGGAIEDVRIQRTSAPDRRAARYGQRTGSFHALWAVEQGNFTAGPSCHVDWVPGGNFGAQRIVFESAGGVDESLSVGAAVGEELEFMLRAGQRGCRVWFDPELRLVHLGAASGGTRHPDLRRYVFGRTHNRAILIRRHSRWYQRPFGLAWSGKLAATFALRSRDAGVLMAALRGTIAGWRAGGRPPVCTRFG